MSLFKSLINASALALMVWGVLQTPLEWRGIALVMAVGVWFLKPYPEER